MITFAEFLAEEEARRGRGRPPLNRFRKEDLDFMRKNSIPFSKTSSTSKINALKRKLFDRINAHDKTILQGVDNMSLDDLSKIVKSKSIPELQPKRACNWKAAEDGIMKGVNKLLDDEFFVLVRKDGKHRKIKRDEIHAELVGGSKESDVKVVYDGSSKQKKPVFFIECKLDFETSEYLKFSLKVINNKLTYDHSYFLSGLNSSIEDKYQREKLDRLFKSSVNVNEFLNEFINHEKVKESWYSFITNVTYMHHILLDNEEFKMFAKEEPADRKFPESTKNLAKIFDLYCNHYTEKYNKLMNDIFDLIDDPDHILNRDDFIIKKRDNVSDISKGIVFKTLNDLLVKLFELDSPDDGTEPLIVLKDESKIVELEEEIKLIEAKVHAVLKKIGKSDPRDLFDLDNATKIMYFFTAFMSSSQRKKTNAISNEALPFATDELGNLQVCSQITDDFPNLAKMITRYYVDKDKCAYIQVKDALYLFDKDFNTFQFNDIPVFKDVMTKFNVRMSVSKEVDRVSLHIRAIDPGDKAFEGMSKISLNPAHSNFIANIEKEHKIVLKH